MISLAMPVLVHVAVALAIGALVAWLYCLVLWREVHLNASGTFYGLRIVVGALLRIAIAAAVLVFAGRGELLATLAALASFAWVRAVLGRRFARPPT